MGLTSFCSIFCMLCKRTAEGNAVCLLCSLRHVASLAWRGATACHLLAAACNHPKFANHNAIQPCCQAPKTLFFEDVIFKCHCFLEVFLKCLMPAYNSLFWLYFASVQHVLSSINKSSRLPAKANSCPFPYSYLWQQFLPKLMFCPGTVSP